jgi:hypothetical protein
MKLKKYKLFKQEVNHLLSIIKKLAPKKGVFDREMEECYYCGADMTDKNNITHKPDCEWLEARKLLEELA